MWGRGASVGRACCPPSVLSSERVVPRMLAEPQGVFPTRRWLGQLLGSRRHTHRWRRHEGNRRAARHHPCLCSRLIRAAAGVWGGMKLPLCACGHVGTCDVALAKWQTHRGTGESTKPLLRHRVLVSPMYSLALLYGLTIVYAVTLIVIVVSSTTYCHIRSTQARRKHDKDHGAADHYTTGRSHSSRALSSYSTLTVRS